MNKFIAFIAGAAVGTAIFFVTKPILQNLDAFGSNRKMIGTAIAIALGLISMILAVLLANALLPSRRDKKVQTGASDNIEDASIKAQLLYEQYAGRLSPKVLEYMEVRAAQPDLSWEDISREAQAFALAGWVIQDHALDNVKLVKVWPFDYNWDHVWQWCSIQARRLWYGYHPDSVGAPYKDRGSWNTKTVDQLAEHLKQQRYSN
jgi:hypothetical protein